MHNASIAAIGDKTAAAQKYRSLMHGVSNSNLTKVPHPHRQCMLDLQAWIASLEQNGSLIIFMMDNNEDVLQQQGLYFPLEYTQSKIIRAANHNGSLATLLLYCNLVDTLAHPTYTPVPGNM